ncbi:hypothetical protein [Streptomyces solicathayae]|uniref:Lipoprotein n=1 Tax=Streptomyces solicathayae TaxID=3081768 RepID=A0ABZ0LVT9_9ACTN|nr:hypothetical protein [Streptomyces sp. HUAS YS2]WOX23301.1 hypothetical protein R2D22_18635 [Streptomyces sp. HUAS YS2]
MAALIGCGGQEDDLGQTDQGGTDKPKESTVSLAPDMVRTALVSEASAPEGWGSTFGEVLDGQEAVGTCTGHTEANCGGVIAYGRANYSPNGGTGAVTFHIYSFQAPDDARATMKSTAPSEQELAESGAKPLEISAGAEETTAFTGPEEDEVVMRVGGVIVRMVSNHPAKKPDLQAFAKIQIDRVKVVAAGGNPDA